jgi:hypothetical protein
MDFDQLSGYAKLGYRMDKYWNISANMNISHFNASNPEQSINQLSTNDSDNKRRTIASIENTYKNTSGALDFTIIGVIILLMMDTLTENNRLILFSIPTIKCQVYRVINQRLKPL